MCESIQSVDPLQAVPGGRINLLWASPECTHHSVARGGRPCSDQSRASAWLILKWLSELYVDRVIVENVPEFLMWGPISAKGTPIQAARGQTFRAWVKALESLGYTVDWRILRAADYGDPTTRRRLFVQAVRGRKRIMWPLPTHSETPEIFNHSPWVPASSVIDWSLPSESIFERKRPLAAATIGRIEAGISRYWGEMAKPFLVILRGTGTTRDIQRPMPAITAGGCHVGLLQPFVIGQQSGAVPRSVTQPLPTVACAGAISLVQPFLIQYYGNGDARSINQPLDTVTCHDRFALVDGVPATLDIRFRMLQPRELASAQGFPVDYFFAGTKTEQVKQIGNAVPCGLAQALCASGMEAA
jgi:DNA (cytosine-5)-methyltransferase 1